MKQVLSCLSFAAALSLPLSVLAQSGNTNFTFAGRTTITNTSSAIEGTTVGATNETGAPTLGQGSTGGLAWWSWAPTQPGRFVINTSGSAVPTVLGVFTGTNLSNLNLLSSGVRFGTSSNQVAFFNASSNQTYQIAIGGNQGATGALSFNILGPLTPPANDAFTNRMALTGTNISMTATNFGASKETGEPNHAGNPGGSSVWFAWTPAQRTGATIDLAGSDFDTLLAVYTGTNLTSLRAVASNDNSGPGTNTSRVSFAASAGTNYQIAVDGKNGAVGTIRLTLSSTNVPLAFSTQPEGQTLSPFGSSLLFGQVSGLPPFSYQWQFNGTNIPSATNATFILRNITNTQAGTYTLVVSNALGSLTSTGAVLSVRPDTNPPTLLMARTFGLSNQVVLTFSKPVMASTLTNLSHFTLNNGISVLGATQDVVNPNVVILTNTAFAPGVTNYSLTVSNITDLAGNSIGTNGHVSLNQAVVELADVGEQVNGFQDTFEGTNRNTNWVAVGPGGDQYVQTNGVLLVTANQDDPNHLLYEAPGYDPEVQEVLARIRVLQFGTNDPPRGGVATAVDPATSQGINFHFRNEGTLGHHMAFLDDLRAWGPNYAFRWQTNVWYWMRLHHQVNTNTNQPDAFAKIWPADGSTSEPVTWQSWNYVPTTSSPTPRSGFAGLAGASLGGLSVFEVDYVLIKALGLPLTNVGLTISGPTNELGIQVSSLHYSTSRGFSFTLLGPTNQAFSLQATTNLVSWVTLTNLSLTASSGGTGSTNGPSGSGSLQFVDPSATNVTYRFYRISP